MYFDYSSMRKKWQIFTKIPEDFKINFPEINPIVLQLLYNRGIKDQPSIDEFLNPDYSQDLHNPFFFKDMDKAVERILKAIEDNEKITIFGDYDADGITSSALLKKFLEEVSYAYKMAAEVDKSDFIEVYIPHRGKEGYGLNSKALELIKNGGSRLVITVDCGISNKEEVEFGNSLGMDIIITDHHYPPADLPNAYAVINPKISGDNYPFDQLAGVGVAFKLVQGLVEKIIKLDLVRNDKKYFDEAYWKSIEKWLLDLVAVGTIADCCPLVGENRTLVKYGLIVLNKTKNLGLRELIKTIGIAKKNSDVIVYSNVDSWSVGFQIAPRINSAGRIDHANTSYKLLVTNDKKEAGEICKSLNETNNKRQNLTESSVQEAIEIIEKEEKDNFAIILKNDKWEAGILGLIAGKIAEYYHRPTFIFTKIGGELVASGRSIPQLNIIEALNEAKEYLFRYGGHSQACGLSLKDESLFKVFKEKFLKIAEERLKEIELVPALNIDMEIGLNEINWDIWEFIKILEPYGEANQRPLFLIKGLKILEIRLVGNDGKHIKLKLGSLKSNKFFNAIGFSLNSGDAGLDWGKRLQVEDILDAAAYVDVNEWNGNRELQLKLVDIKLT